jgi:hypothetical protein
MHFFIEFTRMHEEQGQPFDKLRTGGVWCTFGQEALVTALFDQFHQLAFQRKQYPCQFVPTLQHLARFTEQCPHALLAA